MNEEVIEQNSIKFINLLNEFIIQNKDSSILIDHYNKNKYLIDINYCFCYSCENGLLDIAEWLLLLKPNINVSVNDEYPFCKACENGHINVAKWLFSIKNDIDISCDDEYSFCMACYNGHLEIAKWLIEIKPTINISIDDNYSFIHACNNEHIEVIEWLYNIKKNLITNIDVISLISNNIEKTSIVDFLFNITPEEQIPSSKWDDAFISACSKNELKFASFIFQKVKNLKIYAKDNEPFYLACRNGHVDIFVWLIGIDPDLHKKYSVNNYAFYNACSNGHYEIVESFLKYSTKTSIELNDINIGFIKVCEKGHFEIVKFFIENYDINISVLNDAFDKTAKNKSNNISKSFNMILRYLCNYNKNLLVSSEALETLAYNQNLSIIKYLYRSNSRIMFSNDFITSAFMGFKQNLNLQKWILKINANLDLSIYNDFIFNRACDQGHLKLIRWLLKIRPNINLLNKEHDYLKSLSVYNSLDIIKLMFKKNPLILDRDIGDLIVNACMNNRLNTVKWILKNKKDYKIDDLDIQTAFNKSFKYDYLKIAKWLYRSFKSIVEPIIDINLDVACEFDSQNIAEWILSLYPRKYILQYNDDGELQDFINFENLELQKISSSNFRNIKECSICQENISDIVTQCNHFYCKYCIIKWILKSKNCPYCRCNLDLKKLSLIY